MKKLAVLGDFLEPHHHAQIDSTAARCGFAADYYPDGHVPAELAGQYEVLYGMPDRAALRTFTSLKWFCGNFAGVDAYLDDALYPSPDVILTNSSGAYGVTIAEHLIMVTLMLLRHASAYVLEAAAHRIVERYGCAALVTGGHGTEDANDVLAETDGTVTWFDGARINNPNTHGTGCTLSSAIASYLALGDTLPKAIKHAKKYLTGALKAQLNLGHGSGPMDHFWKYR